MKIRFFSMAPCIRFTIVIWGLIGATLCPLKAQTGNRYWSLPPNYYEVPTGQIFPLPIPTNGQPFDYQGDSAWACHNLMQDANGGLLFFIIDGKVFDKDGYLIDELRGGTATGGQEICIVPDPGNCQRYYFFTSTTGNFSKPHYAILDLSLPRSFYNIGRMGDMVYFNGSDNTFDISNLLPFDNWLRGRMGYAASKLRSDNSRFIFLHNGKGWIYRFKLTSSGLSFDNYFLSTGGNESQNLRAEVELVELPNGKYRIACSSTNNSPGSHNIFYTDLDANGNAIAGTNHNHYFNTSGLPLNNNGAKVWGLEFSPDGNYLYFTHSANNNHPNPIEYIKIATHTIHPLIVSHQNEFQFSQIEYGQDGRLYFASNNKLAVLNNPNSPDTINWTPNLNVIGYSYSPSSDFPMQGPDTFSYTLPDQIDGMDYTAHFFVNEQCCLQSTFFHADTFVAQANATWTPGVNSNPFGSTNGEVLIEKQLIIPAGKTIAIQNMTFKFAPGAKVVVERSPGQGPGGKLILDNSTFTADTRCDSTAMWLGVQVYGHKTLNQTPYSSSPQGWLILRNGALIEHAFKGAIAFKLNHDLNWPFNFTSSNFNFAGGVIQASHSSFKNNRVDVEIRAYTAPNNVGNQSRFTRCSFLTNGLLNKPNLYPLMHVYLADISGVGFYGNRFENLTPHLYSYWKQGSGIFSFNSHYQVVASCNTNFTPCTGFQPNEFTNLYWGIRALSNNTRTVSIHRNTFKNYFYGIYLAGVNYATVTKNQFEVYRSGSPNQTFPTYGLYLNGCTGYKVEENSLTEFNDLMVAAGGNTHGIIVNNSGPWKNQIYKNEFTNLKIGGQSQLINADLYTGGNNHSIFGLQWKCNRFIKDIFQADLAVTSGRIDYQQGYSLSPINNPTSYLSAPAGNRFSHSGFNAQNDFAANNSVQSIMYNHHADTITTPFDFNNNVIGPNVAFSPSNLVYFSPSGSCPSRLNEHIQGQLGSSLREQSDSLSLFISEKQHLIDGGNSQNLLNSIGNPSSASLLQILSSASPFLSDQVLLAYLATSPPPADLLHILLANSPVSALVMNQLNAMGLPQAILDSIVNNQTGMSAMTNLINEIGFAKSERERLIDTRIRLFLNDTLSASPLDSVALILKNEDSEIRKKQLCDIYITLGDSLKISEMRDSIAAQYGIDNYIKMVDLHQKISAYASANEALRNDTSLKLEVESLAYDFSDEIVGIKAKTWIAAAFDSLFLANIEPLDGFEGDFTGENTESKGMDQLKTQARLSIYPNPSNGSKQIIIELKPLGEERLENAYIGLYTIAGQLLSTQKFEGPEHKLMLTPHHIASGLYLIKLFSTNALIETQKLLIYH